MGYLIIHIINGGFKRYNLMGLINIHFTGRTQPIRSLLKGQLGLFIYLFIRWAQDSSFQLRVIRVGIIKLTNAI